MIHPEKIIHTTTTDFDQYQVVERRYEGRQARVLFSGQRRAAQSGIALDDNPDLLFDYNQRLLEIANAKYPKRILLVGGGAYSLPMALLAALPDAQLTVVELDPGLRPIAERYFGLRSDPRLRLETGDGRQFIAATEEQYDLIILDVFSELQVPRQFLTRQFVGLVRDRLTPGGALAMNIIASYKGMNDGLIRSQIAAYNEHFLRLDIYPAAYDLTAWLPQNLILLAQTEPSEDYTYQVRFAPIDPPHASAADMLED